MILEPEEFLKKSEEAGAGKDCFIKAMDCLTDNPIPFYINNTIGRKTYFKLDFDNCISLTAVQEKEAVECVNYKYTEAFKLLKHIAN